MLLSAIVAAASPLPAFYTPNLRISVPTLLVQGGDDSQIAAGSTMEVQRRLRERGANVSSLSYPTADHGSVLTQSIDDVASWVAVRLAATHEPGS